MSLTLDVPKQYPYVLAVAASTAFLNLYLSTNVMKHRKASGIKYPNMYASSEQSAKDPAAFKFNCAQRAHGNFLEGYASFLTGLVIAGLRWPVAAASLGSAWVVARILYAIGYTNKGPGGRMGSSLVGSLSSISLTVMALVSCAFWAWDM